jgi:pSer/pThr/pTyr-binding forkhead associated (FHA) protein
MVQPERRRASADEPAPQVEAGATMIYKPKPGVATEAVSAEELGVERERVSLEVDGRTFDVTKRRTVIGRSKECDVQLSDANVSRRHAELRQEGATYWIVDLDSTNGTDVNGRRLKRAKLENGDRITVGSTDLVFTRSNE